MSTKKKATASGNSGAAMSSGRNGKARGKDGCVLFLVRRDDDRKITHHWSGLVGQGGIEADVFYRLDEAGQPQKVAS